MGAFWKKKNTDMLRPCVTLAFLFSYFEPGILFCSLGLYSLFKENIVGGLTSSYIDIMKKTGQDQRKRLEPQGKEPKVC